MALKNNGGNRMVESRNYIGNISRTKVNRHFEFRTTFRAGKLLPIFADEIYPGQTVSLDLGELVRSITPLGPVMDKSFLDIFFFFVPNRLVWDHWEEFIAGYNKEAWAQDVVYTIPQIKFSLFDDMVFNNKYPDIKEDTVEGVKYYYPSTNSFIGSFLDYLPGACDVCVLADWYRSEYESETGRVAGYNEFGTISALYPRAYVKIWNDWFRDENLQDEYELYTGDEDQYADQFAFNLLSAYDLPSAAKYHNRFTSCLPSPVKGPDVLIPMTGLQVGFKGSDLSGDDVGVTNQLSSGLFPLSDITNATPINAVANNVSNTIRMLRLATQTELLLARDARGGTRYVESLLSHFGVHNGDARLQRSEYLGSQQIPLQVQQVTNNAQSVDSPLGNVGGQSVTRANHHYFTKSFSEHGILFGLATVRTNISYSSGIRKMYQRKERFDFIWPEFKHIGDVPLYTKELEVNVQLIGDGNHVFGYTPYGSELREGYNFNNGLFRYKADGSLDYLTYQEKYLEDNPPYLSAGWIEQPEDIVSNTLVVQTGPQYYALFELNMTSVIPLDPTSDPGLMDHF